VGRKEELCSKTGTKIEMYYKDNRLDSELHRLDGPAIVWYDKVGKVMKEFYFIDGIQYEDIFKYLVAVGSIGE
jgi:antitoxin component YwqK of YwqJK toxin-antitoxin module